MKLHFSGRSEPEKEGIFFRAWLNREDFEKTSRVIRSQEPHHNPLLHKGTTMNFGTAWYVAEPYAEIYVFIDEEPSDLPESAVKIVDEKEPEIFLATLQPYFVMAGES